MSILRLALVVVVLLAIILYTLRNFLSKTVILSTPYTMAVITHPVIIDLTIYISPIVPPSTCKLDPQI
jgi:hypothetical protein